MRTWRARTVGGIKYKQSTLRVAPEGGKGKMEIEIKSLDELKAFLSNNTSFIEMFLTEKSGDELIQAILAKTAPRPEITEEEWLEWGKKNPENEKVDSLFDSRVSKAVVNFEEKFTKEKLPLLVEEEYKKRNPGETPESEDVRNLKNEIRELKDEGAEAKRKSMNNYATAVVTGKMYPGFDPSKFIGATEEETKANLEAQATSFEEYVSERIQTEVDKVKGETTPPRSGTEDEENPFLPGPGFNLTKQGILAKKDPEKAERLRTEAEKK